MSCGQRQQVWSASPPQVMSLPLPAKARRAGPPVFPTPNEGSATGSQHAGAADAASDAAAWPVAVPLDAAAELPDVPGEAKSPVPGEAVSQLQENDEAAAKRQLCYERLDAAEPWLIWVKLCVGSFVRRI